MSQGESDDLVAEVAYAYDLLVAGPLREGASLPWDEVVENLLRSGRYFDLLMPKTSKVLRLQSSFGELARFVDTNFAEGEKDALNVRMKEILEMHLAEFHRREAENITARANRDVVISRLPVSVDGGFDFIKSLEILLHNEDFDLIPCEVNLFGPVARGDASPKSYVNIAVISVGFCAVPMDKRKELMNALTQRSKSRLIPIGVTPDEAEQKYALGETIFLFRCRERPAFALNWELSREK